MLGSLINKILRSFGFVLFRAKPSYHYVPNIYGRSAVKLRDVRENKLFREAAELVMKQGMTKHYYDRLYHLYQAAENVARIFDKEKEIIAFEAGAWKGGTTYFMAYLFNKLLPGKVRMYSIDTFKGHSTKDLPQGKEGKRHVPGLFGDTSFEEVKNYLSPFSFVEVVKGRIQDMAPRFSSQEFHFVHLDMDIAEPTRFALSFFGGRMVRGGIIIVDDYGFFETSPGIEKIVEEYVQSEGGKGVIRFDLVTGQCILVFP